ncbi:DMT family transporter [Clostridium formicaceticum]|uniref:Cysteine transporter n=1 Tax=Clostridium formicaceticum TaxID=1497 RepID=A0AAC9WGS5_9CLOT|nr:DMT family transporter [Clostridium formicaceticum]AOY77643.1 cysteine transporter [Clostridium formicaceticum]ARE88228.1 S-adenosylmethionine/S-adenosylhomocysteine transporter [Clostridium formicaceticum]
MSKYRVWILLIVCNLFWAGNYVFGKYVTAEMTPLAITFSRWVLAVLLLFPTAHFLEKPEWRKAGKSWKPLVMMGILGIICYNLSLYAALDYTSATNAALVNSLAPGTIAVLSVIMLGERISKLQILGILISLIGVLLVLTEGNLMEVFQMQYNRGDLIMLFAVVVWTLYSIIGKRVGNMIPPITATAISALFAIALMLPFIIREGMNLTQLSLLAIIGVLYIAICASVCSFVFWNMAIREIGASKAGIFINLMPVFTALISWSLGESITAAQIAGGLFVFTGVYFTTGMLERKLKERQQEKLSV